MSNKETKTDLPKETFCIERYDGKKPARIPDALYDFKNVKFEIRNIRYFRLLITISQNVTLQESNPELFKYSDYAIKRKDLIKYLGLTTTKINYNLIKELEEEIKTCMPYFKIVKQGPKGVSFMNIYWFEYFGYNAETDYIMYKLTESAKPFITSLQRYNKVTPTIANLLNNEVQAWLYPWLKSAANLKTMMEVSVDELKAQLVKATDKTYDETQYPNAVTRFFNKVLGIRKKPKGRTFVKIDVTYVEMEIINNNQVSSKSINYINELTDITVAVWAKRKCRKYVGLAFDVKMKENYVEQPSEINIISIPSPANKTKKHAEIDCVKRNHAKVKEEAEYMANLFDKMAFDIKPEDIFRDMPPAEREELNFDQMKQKWIAYVNAYGSNVPGEINTVGKFAKRMGYKYDESKGTYYK